MTRNANCEKYHNEQGVPQAALGQMHQFAGIYDWLEQSGAPVRQRCSAKIAPLKEKSRQYQKPQLVPFLTQSQQLRQDCDGYLHINQHHKHMPEQHRVSLVNRIRMLYPIWIVVAALSVAYVPSQIFVMDDVSSTFSNVVAHQTLFRLGIVGTIATAVLMVYISFFLFLLFEHINKHTARLMLILALVSVPLIGFEVFKIVALDSESPDYVYHALHVSNSAMIVSSVFWGLWLLPLGRLVIESNYFPKLLGYLLVASCFGYLLGAFIKIVLPQYTGILMFSEVLTFGEVVFALWFIIKGIRVPHLDEATDATS